MKNRIARCIDKAKAGKRKVLCPFITAGYPSRVATKQLIRGFEKMGVDLVELGIPFSDPLADGPVIQATSFEALKQGISLKDCCRLVKELRDEGCEIPIVFFSYINPILSMGYRSFVALIKQSGVDGVLCPDLPYGVENELVRLVRRNGISFIRLIAPNTPSQRRGLIAADSDDFIYYVSRKGITGTQTSLSKDLKREVHALKRLTKKYVLVGFGISTSQHVREVLSVSDGAIVGSAILNVLRKFKSIPKTLSFTRALLRGVPR